MRKTEYGGSVIQMFEDKLFIQGTHNMLTDDQLYLLNTYQKSGDRAITVMPAEVSDAAWLVYKGYLEKLESESGRYVVRVISRPT